MAKGLRYFANKLCALAPKVKAEVLNKAFVYWVALGVYGMNDS